MSSRCASAHLYCLLQTQAIFCAVNEFDLCGDFGFAALNGETGRSHKPVQSLAGSQPSSNEPGNFAEKI
jgi:hypothetical protein